MSIICTRCGGTQVVCEATVNPNTKVITEISTILCNSAGAKPVRHEAS